MDAAMPGGSLDLGAGYRDEAVKSLVLVTDEDPDDGPSGSGTEYSNSFATGSASGDIQALLDENGFLNNIIRETGTWETSEEHAARPSGALFEIATFRDNREQFFADFTYAEIQEIEQVTQVPLPETVAPAWLRPPGSGLGALGLLGAGLLGMFAAIRRRRS